MTWFKNLRELLGLQSQEMCLCMIVSEQEGAEIWIDGKKTSFLTPKLVSIEMNRPVEITLKLLAHEPHSATVTSPHKLTYYYCNLQRIPLRLVSNEIHSSTPL